MSWDREKRIAELPRITAQRILTLDGAMGTMIQRHKPDEAMYRGGRFSEFNMDLQGNNDLLSLTQPDMIREIHEVYLDSGSDIIETNTFSSTRIAQADYALENYAYEMNFEGAKLARQACDKFEAADPSKPRYVAGAIGPTNRTCLLYTSPSPRDATLSRMPSSA